MMGFKLLRLLLHLFCGLAIRAFFFPFLTLRGREASIRRWSAKLLKICGVTVEMQGVASSERVFRGLIVANHVSWIDIFVINSLCPCRFVAKSDIRGWPLIGWLCEKTGTIFILRGKSRDVRKIYQGLVSSLHAGEHIAFFPEGTTSAQGALLPFHANLFEAAIKAQVPIQPYALRYVDASGQLHGAADFIDKTTFVQSIVMILQAKCIKAHLLSLQPIKVSGIVHRRELADAAYRSIAQALGYLEPAFRSAA